MHARSVLIIPTLAVTALAAILYFSGTPDEPDADAVATPSLAGRAAVTQSQHRGSSSAADEPSRRAERTRVDRQPMHTRGEPDVEAERAAVREEARAYRVGATNAFFHERSFRAAFLAQADRKLPAVRAAMRDVDGLLELGVELDIAAAPPPAVTDRMATLDLLGDLAAEDEDSCALLIELILDPIDVSLPDHVKRILVAERYEAMIRLASLDWERARSTFQRLSIAGLRDVLRPALAEGLAAAGLPYENAFAVAQTA